MELPNETRSATAGQGELCYRFKSGNHHKSRLGAASGYLHRPPGQMRGVAWMLAPTPMADRRAFFSFSDSVVNHSVQGNFIWPSRDRALDNVQSLTAVAYFVFACQPEILRSDIQILHRLGRSLCSPQRVDGVDHSRLTGVSYSYHQNANNLANGH